LLAPWTPAAGQDLEADKELLWVAREGLKAPLPADWKPCKSPEGEIYYFNFTTGERCGGALVRPDLVPAALLTPPAPPPYRPCSVWDHPCDEYYKQTYKDEKENLAKRKAKDAEEERKRKEEKKERKRKKKEQQAAQAQAQAQAAAMPGGGGGGGGGAAGGLPALGSLGPIKTLNQHMALPAPKLGPTKAECVLAPLIAALHAWRLGDGGLHGSCFTAYAL
jgi:centrosomal protein CEP164